MQIAFLSYPWRFSVSFLVKYYQYITFYFDSETGVVSMNVGRPLCSFCSRGPSAGGRTLEGSFKIRAERPGERWRGHRSMRINAEGVRGHACLSSPTSNYTCSVFTPKRRFFNSDELLGR